MSFSASLHVSEGALTEDRLCDLLIVLAQRGEGSRIRTVYVSNDADSEVARAIADSRESPLYGFRVVRAQHLSPAHWGVELDS